MKRNQFEFLSGRAGKRSPDIKRDQGRDLMPFRAPFYPWFIGFNFVDSGGMNMARRSIGGGGIGSNDLTPRVDNGKPRLECGRVAMVGFYFMCKV